MSVLALHLLLCMPLPMGRAAAAAERAAGPATLVTINNTRPRMDTRGRIMNAHDGTVRWLEGAWWMHAAEYGECADPPRHGGDSGKSGGCGFGPLHNISIYRSPDLSSGSWSFVGQAVQCAKLKDCGVLYRPHLTWNPNTKLYVLMYNYVYSRASGKSGYAGNGVATAPHPSGPFTMQTELLNTTYHTVWQNFPATCNCLLPDASSVLYIAAVSAAVAAAAAASAAGAGAGAAAAAGGAAAAGAAASRATSTCTSTRRQTMGG
eukprot:SAG11_NODE_8015_length_1069_cov_1.567010_2_plen_263_part_00